MPSCVTTEVVVTTKVLAAAEATVHSPFRLASVEPVKTTASPLLKPCAVEVMVMVAVGFLASADFVSSSAAEDLVELATSIQVLAEIAEITNVPLFSVLENPEMTRVSLTDKLLVSADAYLTVDPDCQRALVTVFLMPV